MLSKLHKVFRESKISQGTTILIFIKHLYYLLFHSKKLYITDNTTIKGVRNIISKFPLYIGTNYVGFTNNKDITHINIGGKMILHSPYQIGKGCRIDIGKDAVVEIGSGGYINPFTKIIIMNGLIIGKNCIVSWDVQFLDEDFHHILYANKVPKDKKIIIKDKVWIGCGVKIYQGTTIPNGCVIASDAVVRGVFEKENCIIAGNPAKIIKENIKWQ